jgi:hypothetical protein
VSNIHPFPAPQGSLLLSLDLVRLPNGEVAAIIKDMPEPVMLRAGETPTKRLLQIARWMGEGGIFLAQEALKLFPVAEKK